jgi:hypothetical protein
VTIPSIKTYPYNERLPAAGVYLCLVAWDYWRFRPFTQIHHYVADGAVLLAILCAPKGRPLWFLMGIAAGAFLTGWLAHLHAGLGPGPYSILIGFPVAAVGIAVLILMRKRRQKAPPANP